MAPPNTPAAMRDWPGSGSRPTGRTPAWTRRRGPAATTGCLVGLVTTAARSAGSADYIGLVSDPPPPPGYGQQPYGQPPPAYGYQYGAYPTQGYWQPPPRIDSKDLRP